jgi:O-antigen ligase
LAWRQALIRENIPIIKERPLLVMAMEYFLWFGRTIGKSHYWDDSAEAHNDYLRLILEIGIIGSLSYLIFLFSIGKNIWQKN